MDGMVIVRSSWVMFGAIAAFVGGVFPLGNHGRAAMPGVGIETAGDLVAACRLVPGPTRRIPDLWRGTQISPTVVHVASVYVTAISGGGCAAGRRCDIAVQQQLTYASLDEGWQQALEVAITADTALRFASLRVGDQIDIDGRAEHHPGSVPVVHVDAAFADCMAVRGQGRAEPVTIDLSALTPAAYGDGLGPLLVEAVAVTGVVGSSAQAFALLGRERPAALPVRLSPRRMPAGAFADLAPDRTHDLLAVAGVLGAGPAGSNQLELWPRSDEDLWVFASR